MIRTSAVRTSPISLLTCDWCRNGRERYSINLESLTKSCLNEDNNNTARPERLRNLRWFSGLVVVCVVVAAVVGSDVRVLYARDYPPLATSLLHYKDQLYKDQCIVLFESSFNIIPIRIAPPYEINMPETCCQSESISMSISGCYSCCCCCCCWCWLIQIVRLLIDKCVCGENCQCGPNGAPCAWAGCICVAAGKYKLHVHTVFV